MSSDHSPLVGLMLDSERDIATGFLDYVSDFPPLDSDTLPLLAAEWGLAYAVRVREMWEDSLDEILGRLDEVKAALGESPMLGAAIWLVHQRRHWLNVRADLAAQAVEMGRRRTEPSVSPQ
jgi:hypothetical protein